MNLKQLIQGCRRNDEMVEHLYLLIVSCGSCIKKTDRYIDLGDDDLPEYLIPYRQTHYDLYYTYHKKNVDKTIYELKVIVNDLFLQQCCTEQVIGTRYLEVLKYPYRLYQVYKRGEDINWKYLLNNYQTDCASCLIDVKSMKVPVRYYEYMEMVHKNLKQICIACKLTDNEKEQLKIFKRYFNKIMRQELKQRCKEIEQHTGFKFTSLMDQSNGVVHKRKITTICASCGRPIISENYSVKYCKKCTADMLQAMKGRKTKWKAQTH